MLERISTVQIVSRAYDLMTYYTVAKTKAMFLKIKGKEERDKVKTVALDAPT